MERVRFEHSTEITPPGPFEKIYDIGLADRRLKSHNFVGATKISDRSAHWFRSFDSHDGRLLGSVWSYSAARWASVCIVA